MMTYQELISTIYEPDGSLKEYRTSQESRAELNKFIDAYNDGFRYTLSARLRDLLNERKISGAEVARRTNDMVRQPQVSRFVGGSPYALSTARSLSVAENVFGMSLHEFVTGEWPKITLPNDLRLVAMTLKDASAEYIKSVLSRLDKVRSEFSAAEVSDGDDAALPTEMFFDRMKEYCSDHYVNSFDIFGEGFYVHTSIRVLIDVAMGFARPEAPEYKKRGMLLRSSLYISARSGIPLDYFHARDYTKFADLVYRKTNDEGSPLVDVTNKSVCRIIGDLLSIPSEKRSEWVAAIAMGK